MPRPSSLLLSVLAVLAVVTAACDGAQADLDAAEAVQGTQVAVSDHVFEPANLRVAPGDTVTWNWEGSATHDVVGEGFSSELQRDGTFTHTFDEPGVYEYACSVHRPMVGQVVVEGDGRG